MYVLLSLLLLLVLQLCLKADNKPGSNWSFSDSERSLIPSAILSRLISSVKAQYSHLST